ncbi:unnamed protein product [Auanema sp. JU1783]|nr:unnamed protein product [Auanema sp. JU1783]
MASTGLTCWKTIRDKLVEERSKYLNFGAEWSYYRPISNNFSNFGNLNPLEQEASLINDVCILFAGWNGEFVRISDDVSNFKLIIHNRMDPYLRSSVERFEEYIGSVVRIRKYSAESGKLKSQLATCVLSDLNRKIDELFQPILVFDYSTIEHPLNNLYQNVAKLKTILKLYDALAREIFENKLVGGQVLNVLDKMNEKVFETDLDNIRQFKEIYWRRFICAIGTWIDRGHVDDPCYEFFIWPTAGISAVDMRTIEDNLPANLKKSSDFVVVLDLCPTRVVPLIESILQCGLDRTVKSTTINWKLLDEYEFSRVVSKLSKSMAEEVLKKMKLEENLDNVIAQIHLFFVLTPCVSWLYDALIKHHLFDRSFNSVRKSEKKTLTQAFHRDFAEKIPVAQIFSFETAETDIFDALLSTNRDNSSMDKSVVPNYYDMLDISVNTSKLPAIFSSSCLKVFRQIFRLHLHLEIASKKLSELKIDLPRTGISDVLVRSQLFLLDRLHRHLIDFRTTIASGVTFAARNFDTEYPNAGSVYELQELEDRFAHEILTSTGLNKAPLVHVLQDLLLLIDSYDKTAFENIQEEYFEWRTKMDALQCF